MGWRGARSDDCRRRIRAFDDRWLRTALLGTGDGGVVNAVALLRKYESSIYR